MKKIKSIALAALCCILCLLPALPAAAAQTNVTVRFAQSRLPDMKVGAALPQSDIQKDAIVARLGQETMQIKNAEKLCDTHKTRIYILLDLSTSMESAYFRAAKDAIDTVLAQRGTNETVVLVTFGTGTPQFYTNDEATAVLPELQPDNEGTKLNEAVTLALQDAQAQTYGSYDYMYGIVISDGTEYSKGSTTAAEIESQLRLQPLAFFGLCADFAGNASMQDFRTLVHETGGTFSTFAPKNAAAQLQALQEEAENVYVLTLQSASNTAAGSALQVKVGETTGVIEYTAQSAVDNTPPSVEEWQYDAEKQELLLTISEPLRRDSIQSENFYLETKNGQKRYPDDAAGENNSVTLHFDNPVPNGSYTLKTTGVTDNSDSQNALTAQAIKIENSQPAAVLWLAQYWYMPVTGAVLLVILVLLVLALRFLKKNGLQKFSDIVTYYKNKRIVIDPGKSEKAPTNAQESKAITFFTENGSGLITKTETTIVSSAIFGRGEHCDVVVQDPKMSRQHFSIGIDSGKMCIQDLGSTNGTFLNGSRVQNMQILHSGDKIFAGTSSITIEFQE